MKKLKIVISNRSQFDGYFDGEWLDKNDIEYLWEYNKYNIVSEYIEYYLYVIDDINLIGKEGFDLFTPFMAEKIKPFLNERHNFFVLFILGTMKNFTEGEVRGTSGHWYPLVMHQNKEGKRMYYITDSYRNKDRMNDTNAWKIINLIES